MYPILNTELVLETPQRLPDGGGGFALDWQPVGTLWAEVASVRAGERQAGEREIARVTYRITVRNAPPEVAAPAARGVPVPQRRPGLRHPRRGTGGQARQVPDLLGGRGREGGNGGRAGR